MKHIKIIVLIAALVFVTAGMLIPQDQAKDKAQAAYELAKKQVYDKQWADAIKSFSALKDTLKNSEYLDDTYYWLAGETELPSQEQDDTDAGALKRGMITVTPIYYDLTRHDLLDGLKNRIEALSASGGPEWGSSG